MTDSHLTARAENSVPIPGASPELRLPFSLHLNHAGELQELVCTTLMRHLPGKRLTCLGRFGDQDVLVKLFIDPVHAERDHQRDENGVRALLARQILTPELLYSGSGQWRNESKAACVLVFRRIMPGRTLAQAWEAADESGRSDLLRRMMVVLARHHNAGLHHRDLHFDNFLVQDEAVYTLDGAEIAMATAPLKPHTARANLGLFFAQLPPLHDSLVEEVLPVYAKLRDWGLDSAVLRKVHKAIRRARAYRTNKFLHKIFRPCSAFVSRKDAHRFSVYDRNFDGPQLRELLASPDAFLAQPDCQPLKLGNTASLGAIEIDGRLLVIKRYNIKGFWHGFARALQGTRAAHSWRAAHLLILNGIATPQPVALLELRFGPLRRTSYFISAYVEGIDAFAYFSSEPLAESLAAPQRARWLAMAHQLGLLFGKLMQARITHGDMKASNIIITAKGPVLLDLDAVRQHASQRGLLLGFGGGFERAFMGDLQRFLKNWDEDDGMRSTFETALMRFFLRDR